MSDVSLLAPCLVSGGAITIIAILVALFRQTPLDAIPTVGSTTRLGSYWTAFQHKNDTFALVQEGYNKYKDSLFKVPMLHYWIVVVSGPMFREDVRRASDDQLSGINAAEDFFKLRYLIGSSLPEDPFSTSILRTRLNRNLVALVPIMRDEITAACDDVLALKHDEWRTVLASDISRTLISRITSRIIVGLPLCRDPEWLNIAVRVGTGVAISGAKLDLFPPFMRPLAAKFLFETSTLVKQATLLVEPIIMERRRVSVDDPPCDAFDVLQWLMEDDDQQPTIVVIQRLLVVIFVSINAVTHTFTDALLHLVAKPECLEELREEVDALVYEHGWTKAALDKMWKVDSFLKETLRLNAGVCVNMLRKVQKDFFFTDGTVIPKGCYIVSPPFCIHHEEEYYPSPNTFDPLRFYRLREKLGESTGHQMITPSPEFIRFGLGKHACPGRFLTAKVQKLLLAHIVSSYDLKPENNTVPQKCAEVGVFRSPDLTTKIMFKKRSD